MNDSKFAIFTDGAARGNPGPAAIGCVIKNEKGETIATISQCLGNTTNNQAEYKAVIAALEKAISLGARQVTLYSDSELVVKQINGQYKVKHPALLPLYTQVKKLTGTFESFKAANVRRESNKEADALANKALDGG